MIKDGKNEFNWVGRSMHKKFTVENTETLIEDVVDTINNVLTQHKCSVQIFQEPVDSSLWEYQCFFSLVEKGERR